MARSHQVLWIALIVASCGLVYELLAGTVASWVLGDTVTQFSTVLGAYLGALGLGAHLSARIEHSLARRFVQIEIAVALVGGLTVPALFATFAHAWVFRAVLYAGVVSCGTLVGLEIPILVRVLEEATAFRSAVARVLTYDYVGSLAGSLLYSLVMLPMLGPMRTALVFGMLNALVALWTAWVMRERIERVGSLRIAALAALAVLGGVFARSQPIIDAVDSPAHAIASPAP